MSIVFSHQSQQSYTSTDNNVSICVLTDSLIISFIAVDIREEGFITYNIFEQLG